jgi:GT2 family glycosyltransferase
VELRPVHLIGRAFGARRLLGHRLGKMIAARVPTLRDHAERVPGGPTEVESLAATAVLVRRLAFVAVGGFDESYFLYGEDLDLCRRLRLAGWKLLALPEVWAAHVSGGSAESTHSRDFHWWQGTMRFGAYWWGGRDWAIALLAAVVRCSQLVLLDPHRATAAFRALVREPRSARRSGRPVRVASLREGRFRPAS